MTSMFVNRYLRYRDFIICIASSRRSVEEAIIGMVSLAIFHPHFTIRILSSSFFHPHFSILIFLSAIRHPPSAAIRRYPVLTLKTRSPSASLPFKGQVTKKTRCCAAVQEKLHDQVITREIKRLCVFSENIAEKCG